MANTKVTGDLIASGTITAANLVSGTLDGLLNTYLITNTYATESYVTTAVSNLIDAAPASLDTLNELAAALNDDANFATTVTNALATKLNLSGGTISGSVTVTGDLSATNLTGTVSATSVLADGVTATTQTLGDNSTKVATTAYVDAQVTASDLDFAGDTGTGAVDLDSQTFTIAGTANEIETVASGQTVTIGLPSSVTVGTLNATTLGGTLSTAAQPNITSVGTLSSLAVSGVLNIKSAPFNVGAISAKATIFSFDDKYQYISIGMSADNATINTNWFSGAGGATPNLVLQTGGVERMRIDSSGNVGIGTSSPNTRLDVNGVINVRTNGYEFGRIKTNNSDADSGGLTFQYNNNTVFTDGLVLNHQGNVGIGTSSPAAKLHINDSGDGIIRLGGSSGMEIIHNNAGNTIAEIKQLYASSSASAQLKLTSGFTTFQVGTSGTEAMRITSGGRVLIGSTTEYAPLYVVGTTLNPNRGILCVESVTAGDLDKAGIGIVKKDNNSTGSQVFMRFAINGLEAGSGQINANGANQAAFGNFSDARLKENIEDLQNQLDKINSLRPVEFDYKDGSGRQIGFIAQEMQEVYPDVIGEGANGMLTVTGWSKTEARLVKAIQELKAEIETLKSQINA